MTDKKIINTAKACLKFIEEDKGNSSFVNIERVMTENGISTREDGSGTWLIPWDDEYENIIVWLFNNHQAQQVWSTMLKLLKEEHRGLQLKPTQPLVYLVDGKALTFPLAKSLREYKKPRWLPVVLSIQDNK